MKVYIDCDVAVKFAQWGLLPRLTQHLIKQGKAELYTVQTLKFRFKLATPDKAAAMLGSMAAVNQLVDFVKVCKAPLGHSQAVVEALVDVPSIDVGEAALFAAAAHFDTALVNTGDKKALRAVGALPAANPAREALAGKLACLEQTLHYVVGRWSYETVSAAIGIHASADATAAACFKSGSAEATLAALKTRVDELTADCGLLASDPFAWIS